MNLDLLANAWIPARDAQGNPHRISPLEVGDPRYADIVAVRPDFRGALYQFLIGLLQFGYAPQDVGQWREGYRQGPSPETLAAALAQLEGAFLLEADGPAFMQDLQLPAGANHLPIDSLLIDAGSDSNLFFNKPAAQSGFCPACAAQALFALQINAPAGGRGVRTSLRGGGPMTTLLVPQDPGATLWQRLWLNVMPSDDLGYAPVAALGSVLPWLSPTRASDGASALDTPPESVHPLQAYWSMPRRIRLDADSADQGDCSVCGVENTTVFRHYWTRHGGTNYTGAWHHPLTPYSRDPKDEAPPLPVKGQPGGVGYRHWLGLALGRDDGQPSAAQVVAHYQGKIKRPGVLLWCFGYDMSNMKARCWYDSTLPVHAVEDDIRVAFIRNVKLMLDIAAEAATALHRQVKAAWFRRPGDTGSEPAIHQSFWQGSESDFYLALAALAGTDFEDEAAIATIQQGWLQRVRTVSMRLFEYWTLTGVPEDRDLQRIVTARAALARELSIGKSAREAWKLVNAQRKENP